MSYIIKPTQHSINQKFTTACSQGKIKAATLLLNSTTSEFVPDERTLNQSVVEAYFFNKIKIMKYLLTSPNLSKKADLNYKNNLLFRCIYADKDYTLLHYLIFDLKIEKTPRIIEELEVNPDKKVADMFLIRELNTELIPNENIKNKRVKI
jgi:hypothetical protein